MIVGKNPSADRCKFDKVWSSDAASFWSAVH